MKYLFFDTETTGFPPAGRLVSIAWQIWENEQFLIKENFIVKPVGFIIPKEAERIHGISTEFAFKNGVDCKMVLNKFNESLNDIDAIVGHNLNFDIKIVTNEFSIFGIDTKNLYKSKIDTMQVSTNYVKLPGKYNGYKWPKLEELYIHLFNTNFEDAHSSDADVNATAKCFFELKKRNVI